MTTNGGSSASATGAAPAPAPLYGQLTPTALSWFVVGRYWQLIHEQPSDLAQLYHPDAHLSRSGGGSKSTSTPTPSPTQAHGRSEIASYYAGQAPGTYVYIKSIDSVPMGSQQFLTQLVGEVALPSLHGGGVLPFRAFTQSLLFTSAASPSDPIDTPGIISILGDILRIETADDDGPVPASAPVANGSAPHASVSTKAPIAAALSDRPRTAAGQETEAAPGHAAQLPISNGTHNTGQGESCSSVPPPQAAQAADPSTSAPSDPAQAAAHAGAMGRATPAAPAAPSTVPAAAASSTLQPTLPPSSASKQQRTWASLAAARKSGSEPGAAAPPASASGTGPQRRLSTVSATSSRGTGAPSQVAPETEGSEPVRPSAAPVPSRAGAGVGSKLASPANAGAQKDASVFIKAVTSAMREADLAEALSVYGRVVNVHLLPHKGGAFVDFDSADAARRALAASHPSGPGQARRGIPLPTVPGRPSVLVEPKRARPEANSGARGGKSRASGPGSAAGQGSGPGPGPGSGSGSGSGSGPGSGKGRARESLPRGEGDGFQAVKGRRGH